MKTPYNLLDMTATVQTPTETVGADGGTSVTWASTYTGVRCTIQPLSSTDRLLYGKEDGLRVSTAYFPPDLDTGTVTPIQKRWRVIANGISYRVVGASMDPAGKGVLQTLTLEEVT